MKFPHSVIKHIWHVYKSNKLFLYSLISSFKHNIVLVHDIMLSFSPALVSENYHNVFNLLILSLSNPIFFMNFIILNCTLFIIKLPHKMLSITIDAFRCTMITVSIQDISFLRHLFLHPFKYNNSNNYYYSRKYPPPLKGTFRIKHMKIMSEKELKKWGMIIHFAIRDINR